VKPGQVQQSHSERMARLRTDTPESCRIVSNQRWCATSVG
jgi:hypothetical protein